MQNSRDLQPRAGQARIPLQCLVVLGQRLFLVPSLQEKPRQLLVAVRHIRLERYPLAKFGLCLFVVLQVLVRHPQIEM